MVRVSTPDASVDTVSERTPVHVNLKSPDAAPVVLYVFFEDRWTVCVAGFHLAPLQTHCTTYNSYPHTEHQSLILNHVFP